MDFVSNMSANDLLELANVLASSFSVAQGVRQLRQADRHHLLDRIHAERQHQRDRNQAERHFNNDHSREVEHHLHDVVSEMVSSNAEADRDMWEQKNSELQMMMLSATVVFSGGFAVAVEGELDSNASFEVELSYSICLALGFAALLMSILLGMILSKRISFFMYAQSKARQRNVQDIIQSGQKLVEMNYARTDHARTGRALTTAQQRNAMYGTLSFRPGGAGGAPTPQNASERRKNLRRYASDTGERSPMPATGPGAGGGGSKMGGTTYQNPQDNRAEFEIREAMAELYTALTSVPQLSFQDYFERYARFWSQSVAHTFIFGTIMLLAATAIMFWSRFVGLHDNPLAGIVFSAILGVVGITCSLLLGNFFFSGIPVDNCFDRASRVVKRSLASLPGSNLNQLEHKLHRNIRRRVAGVGSSFTNQRNLNTLLTEEFGKMIPAAAVPLMQQVHRILRQKLEMEDGALSPRSARQGGLTSRQGASFWPHTESSFHEADEQRARLLLGPNLAKLEKYRVVALFKRIVRNGSSGAAAAAASPRAGDEAKTERGMAALNGNGAGSAISIRELRIFLEREVTKHYQWNLFQENAWILMWDVNGDGIISLEEFWRGIVRAEMTFLEEEFHNLRSLYEQIDAAVKEGLGSHLDFRDAIASEIDAFEARRQREHANRTDGASNPGPRKNLAGERMYTVFEWRVILNNLENVALTDLLLTSMFLWAGSEAFWLDRTEYAPNMLLYTEVNRESRLSEVEVQDFLAPSNLANSKLVNTIDFLWRGKQTAERDYDKVVMASVKASQRAY
uniref:Uncharacterized protein n=1 Tax=Phaeomonas parva TaxID=124430 RepID=A0A7S1XLL8_9STRA|mmetsp:Transcript_14308/g.42904  ORF Transcript_14308/g.42904 Transcript_14308/m.42904 type:complete len:796 (+) Transcript_14308:204-2591(+)